MALDRLRREEQRPADLRVAVSRGDQLRDLALTSGERDRAEVPRATRDRRRDGLIELKAGGVLDSGKPNPLSVLAPTLLAVAAAVVALRMLPFLARQLARWTRESRRLATFPAVRQLLRRPAEARAVLLVAVAVSIAVFAVSTWIDSRHNRSLRALNSAGAHTVLVVRPGAGVYDLRTAVDRADPGGHSMAVAYTNVDGLPPLIAVDTARFASIGAWVRSNSSPPLRSVLRRLRARAAPVTVTGTRLRLHIDLIRHPRQPVHLAVTVTEPNHSQEVLTVGPIAPGTGSYDTSLPSVCASGCPIAALGLTANTPENLNAYNLQVSEIDAVIGASTHSGGGWQPVMAFGDHTRWREDGKGPETIGTTGASLSLDVRQVEGSSWPSAVPAAIPNVIARGDRVDASRSGGGRPDTECRDRRARQSVAVRRWCDPSGHAARGRPHWGDGRLWDRPGGNGRAGRADDPVPGVALVPRAAGHGRDCSRHRRDGRRAGAVRPPAGLRVGRAGGGRGLASHAAISVTPSATERSSTASPCARPAAMSSRCAALPARGRVRC